ncbi:MAG: hypothetical protein WCV79_00460 [Candidatus Paceibacterota bacterium]|jgi:hypothetical protein
MAKNYPRLQTVIIFVICATAVVIFGMYVYGKRSQNSNPNTAQIIKVQGNKESTSEKIADTNWQKQFFSGDAKDTIKLNQSAKVAVKENKQPTLTDQIGQDFFSQFWQIHQSGLEGDEKVMNSFSERFASQVAAAAVPELYSSSDIQISNETSESATVTYVKKILEILKKLPASDAAIIANNALKEGGSASLSQIDPIITSYRSTLKSLRTIPVPLTFSSPHLNLVNAVSAMLFNAESLRKVDVDPVKGLAAVSIYIQGLQSLSDALGDVEKGFAAAGIVFTNANPAGRN